MRGYEIVSFLRGLLKDVTQAVVDNTEPKAYPKVEARQIDSRDSKGFGYG